MSKFQLFDGLIDGLIEVYLSTTEYRKPNLTTTLVWLGALYDSYIGNNKCII